MQYDAVHFENAKGHAVVLFNNAEKALEEGNVQYAGLALDDAHSYLTTMRDEAYRDDAPDAVRAKYEEIAARYNAAKEKYEEAISEVEEKTEREKIEEAEEVADALEQEAALRLFDVACNLVEGLLDDYAEELADNHCASDATEKAIFCKLASLLEKRRELPNGDAKNARWRRVERLKERFHNLKRLGAIARRFWKIKDALFE